MAPFWGWMALAVILAFVLVFLVLRLFVVQEITVKWFLLFAGVASLLVLAILLAVSTIGVARDAGGRYASSDLKSWFDSLRSGRGPCCSDADGYALADVDWAANGVRYRVRIPRSNDPDDATSMIWIDVPSDAVISEPNRAGRTMVWPIWGYQGPSIRCFMPGSMT